MNMAYRKASYKLRNSALSQLKRVIKKNYIEFGGASRLGMELPRTLRNQLCIFENLTNLAVRKARTHG